MSEEQPADHQSPERPDERQPLAAVFEALGIIVAVAGPVIAIIHGGRLLLGVCLIIAGLALGAAFFARRITRRYRQVSDRWRRLAAAAAGVLLVGFGAVILAIGHQASSSAACQKPAEVSGANTSALQFTIAVNLPCIAQSGNQLFLIEQLLNEGVAGTVKHSEYYLGWEVKNATGPQTFADSPAGCVPRRYYVISVNQDQLALLEQSQRTTSGSYYGDPMDADIGKYIVSNVQMNHTCNKQS